MANKTVTINGVEIDAEKSEMLLRRIIIKEKTNIKTKQYNDGEMIKMIKKLIEEVAECY